MNLTDAIPVQYRLLAVAGLAVAVFGFGYLKGAGHESAKNDAAEAARVKVENAAILQRVADNKVVATRQAAYNEYITDTKNAEIAKIRTDAAAITERMRKPAFCGGSTATTQAPSPGSSNGGNPPSGLVPEAVAADIRALMIKTEEVTATGRACQAFVRNNGLSP